MGRCQYKCDDVLVCVYTPYRGVCKQAVLVGVCTGRMAGCLYRPYFWVSVQAVRVSVCTGRTGEYLYKLYMYMYMYMYMPSGWYLVSGICTRLTGE